MRTPLRERYLITKQIRYHYGNGLRYVSGRTTERVRRFRNHHHSESFAKFLICFAESYGRHIRCNEAAIEPYRAECVDSCFKGHLRG